MASPLVILAQWQSRSREHGADDDFQSVCRYAAEVLGSTVLKYDHRLFLAFSDHVAHKQYASGFFSWTVFTSWLYSECIEEYEDNEAANYAYFLHLIAHMPEHNPVLESFFAGIKQNLVNVSFTIHMDAANPHYLYWRGSPVKPA